MYLQISLIMSSFHATSKRAANGCGCPVVCIEAYAFINILALCRHIRQRLHRLRITASTGEATTQKMAWKGLLGKRKENTYLDFPQDPTL